MSLNTIHWFEAITMLLTGPFLMYYAQLTLELYGVKNPSQLAIDIVPWFGALVTLMGWLEWRLWKRLPRAWIEACLIADILYGGSFFLFIQRHGEWNIWSLFSIGFPVVYAPMRYYWLFHTNSLHNY